MFRFAARARHYFGAIVLTVALLVAGGLSSATRMPSGVSPEVTFPRIAVVAKKPGLDLRGMELQVTIPLEQAVSTVVGVERVRSQTIRGGCDLSIDFTPGTDMKQATHLTWERVGAARSGMPPDVDLTVEQMTPSVFPIMSVVLTGGDSAALRDYAYYQLAPTIKNVPDVLYCNVAGGDLREIEVIARPDDLLRAGLSAADRFDPGLVRRQWLLPPAAGTGPTPPGTARMVLVDEVARVTPVRAPEEQARENQQPAIFVTAEIAEGEAGLGSVAADIRAVMAEMEQEGKVPPGYRWELGGHYVRQQEAFRSLAVVMVVAVLLVFIMLAFQFRSVVLPLLSFLTQPLSLVSGLFALWLTNTPLNVSSYMGAVLLIGLDMKNGILLVEYIQQLRAEGMELRPALLEAGRTRFRPILMTSLAAILGLFPLALGIGPGAQMQQPLAIVVIGGLTANMLFTRMIIPVGYLVLERRRPAPAA
jgi:multidrug efflux pump subunit AcrB